MPDNQKLLQILSVPGFHSGTRLGEELGISRVAIKNRMQSLIDQGVPIQAVHGKGYCLEQGVVLLQQGLIRERLSPSVLAKLGRFSVLSEVASTNEFLATEPLSDEHFNLCIAEAQTAGRGRRGRHWLASPYRNIIMSLSWQFERWPNTISGLGLAASLVVAEQLRAQYEVDVMIKWPNDLLVDGAKIAGVLVDVSGESGGACRAILGLGLNVSQVEKPQALEYPVQDMTSLGCHVDRNDLVPLVVNAWVDMLGVFAELGFSAFQSRWNELSSYYAQEVVVVSKKESVTGFMRGVDASGALLLEVDGCMRRFVDSSVSVRLQ